MEKVLELFQELTREGGAERRDIELANFFELAGEDCAFHLNASAMPRDYRAANAVLGTQNVKQFIYDLVFC